MDSRRRDTRRNKATDSRSNKAIRNNRAIRSSKGIRNNKAIRSNNKATRLRPDIRLERPAIRPRRGPTRCPLQPAARPR